MESKRNQLFYLIKAMGSVTIESLPEIIELVPGYGPLLSKVLSKVLSVSGEYVETKSADNIEEKIDLLKKAIQDNKITESDFKITVQNEITNYLKKNELRLPAYMFGVVLYPLEGQSIEEEDMESIDNLFSDKYNWNEEMIQDYAEKINEFSRCHNGGIPFKKGKDYYLNPACLIINFYTDSEKFRRDDEEILNFIENLNGFLGKILFAEYTIF